MMRAGGLFVAPGCCLFAHDSHQSVLTLLCGVPCVPRLDQLANVTTNSSIVDKDRKHRRGFICLASTSSRVNPNSLSNREKQVPDQRKHFWNLKEERPHVEDFGVVWQMSWTTFQTLAMMSWPTAGLPETSAPLTARVASSPVSKEPSTPFDEAVNMGNVSGAGSGDDCPGRVAQVVLG